MTVHNKLVRDGIPEMIVASGEGCIVRELGEAEYISALLAKLVEEAEESRASGALAELADVVEVVRALLIALGHTWDELEAVRESKLAQRGGFRRRLLLEFTGG